MINNHRKSKIDYLSTLIAWLHPDMLVSKDIVKEALKNVTLFDISEEDIDLVYSRYLEKVESNQIMSSHYEIVEEKRD